MKPHILATIASSLFLLSDTQAQAPTPTNEAPRMWTLTATGKGNSGTLLSKKPDNSSIVIKMENGREVTVRTADLIPADREYVTKWTAPEPVSTGIVLDKVSLLSQGTGGNSLKMAALQSVIKDYGVAENDIALHPDVLVYKGPAPYDGGPAIEIPYLMKSDKAAALLMKRPGISSPTKAQAPGFPPGMRMREYDIRFGVFNRLFIITDQIDQVVAVQIKSENGDSQDFPQVDWKPAVMSVNSTSDFIVSKTDGARRVTVGDYRKSHKFIAIDLESRGETILYMPEPLIRLSLFHMSKDQRNSGSQQGAKSGKQIPTTPHELKAFLDGTSWRFDDGKVITLLPTGKIKKSWGVLEPKWAVSKRVLQFEDKNFSFNEDFTVLEEAGKTEFKGKAVRIK